jgi:outer membrane protein OmpA-like peptidoglycan-associated protein
MGTVVRFSLLFLLFILCCGCAKKTLVALVPDPDGKSGSITISNEAGDVAIDAPYQASTIADAKKRPTAPATVGKEALDKVFAEALSIEPQRPLHFLLYFQRGTTLNCKATRLLSSILSAIRERKSVDISVIGHTDTLGSSKYNMELSRKRAEAVKELLVRNGVPAESIATTSHGKENPLIPTADNVYEPRNRRVEVVVR